MKFFKFAENLNGFFSRNKDKIFWALLFLSVLVFLAISVIRVGSWSVWFDESFSVFMIKQNFLDIWKYTALDVNSPLYYFLLKIWSLVFGDSDAALRMLSVVCGAGVILSGSLLVRKLFGTRAGLLSLPLITLSPMLIRYATEMRGYTLLVLILMLSTHAVIKATKESSQKHWLVYGFLVALAMWTHYYSALVIVAHMVYRALVIHKRDASSEMKNFKKSTELFFDKYFVRGVIFAFVLFLPWVFNMAIQLLTVQTAGFWIPPFGLDTFGNFLSQMMAYETHDKANNYIAVGIIASLIIAAIIVLRSWNRFGTKTKNGMFLVLAVTILPPIILTLLSLPPLRPMFINRYIIFSMIAFNVVVAALVGLRMKSSVLARLQVILFVLVIGLNIFGLTQIMRYGNYNFDTKSISVAKDLMQKVDNNSPEKIAVIAESTWLFYDAVAYETDKNPVYFLDSTTSYEYGSLAMLKDEKQHKITDLRSFAKSGHKIWFISTSLSPTPPMLSSDWKKLREISVKDAVYGANTGTAIEYQIP